MNDLKRVVVPALSTYMALALAAPPLTLYYVEGLVRCQDRALRNITNELDLVACFPDIIIKKLRLPKYSTAKWKHIWIGNWRRFTRNSLRWTEKRAGPWAMARFHFDVKRWSIFIIKVPVGKATVDFCLSLSTDTTFSAQSPWNENWWWELLRTRARRAEEDDLVSDGRSPICTILSWTRQGEVQCDGVFSRPGQWVSRVTRIQLLSNEMWRDGNSSYEALAFTDLVTHCMTWLVGDKIRTVVDEFIGPAV